MFAFVNSVAMNSCSITRSLGLIRMNFCDWDFGVKELADFFFFFFGLVKQLAGSQFPDQGLNLGHSSERLES